MKLSNSFFYTLREDAKDEDSVSSNLLVRAGMIKKSSNGIYMIMPMGKKVLAKIENIIREEMDAKDAQELLMPALIPEEVYEKSGRRDVFGSNMFSMYDRYAKRYVLGPTHEELFAVAASMDGKSYKDFPYNLYQIQTKYRDETRPRYGLIRVREFIMKDAYTFDIDQAGLDVQYDKMYDAYCRIFDRLNLDYKIVKADTGAMGGLLSEEYQAISSIGEDVLVLCDTCDFASNLEITPCVCQNENTEEGKPIEMVDTQDKHTIEEVVEYLNLDIKKTIKALLMNVDGEFVVFFVRGDRELNECKALKVLNAKEIGFADDELIGTSNAVPGCTGPVGLNAKIVIDNEVLGMKNFCCGANKEGYHYINANVSDFTYDIAADIVNVQEGDVCPCCGKPLSFKKGIEVGNLFKLGTKYAQTMDLYYTDQNNKLQPVWMGSYGIGLERCMAAVVDQHHDDKGIIWPKEIAPFILSIVPISLKDEKQAEIANDLYEYCQSKKYSVLYDDRNERPGVKFKDMELIGIPYRITVGRGIANGVVEFVDRYTGEKTEISIDEIKNKIDELYK